MKIGQFFRIPERAADIEHLWKHGQPLSPTTRPVWVSPDDAAGYRLLGSASWPNPPRERRDEYFTELQELRDSGIIVEQAPNGLCDHRFLLRAPTGPWNNDAEFAVGLYEGENHLSLRPAVGVANPILTRAHVTDIPASFVADPFMIRADGTWHLFVEIMHAKSGLGVIGLATSRDARAWTYKQVVLSEPFHLSYPQVFAWKNDFYMVPESYQAGGVRLYRADDFPTKWKYVRTLLAAPFVVDASIFRHADRWWMFADTSPGMDNSRLSLYFASQLEGPWQEHPKSPVIDGDPLIARPGGRVLAEESRLVRFTQACTPYYGTAVRGFEIVELTPTTYREAPLSPAPLLSGAGKGWNARGMHHIDLHHLGKNHWIACVDGWTSPSLLGK
jgi:hypothetical protein